MKLQHKLRLMAGFCTTGVEALRFTARKLVTQSFYADSAGRIFISSLLEIF